MRELPSGWAPAISVWTLDQRKSGKTKEIGILIILKHSKPPRDVLTCRASLTMWPVGGGLDAAGLVHSFIVIIQMIEIGCNILEI